MKIRAKLSLRNETMLAAREALGFNQPKMAEACGVPVSVYMAIEKMDLGRVRPGLASWDHAWAIASFCQAEFELIAPPELRGEKLKADTFRVLDVAPGNLLGMSSSTQRLALPAIDRESDRLDLVEALATLPYRERVVLTHRYGIDGGPERSLEEIGATLRISRERVRQLERRAILKLREPREKLVKLEDDDAS